MKKGNYGLFTAIAMITGIVIGSGIFFKSDDILTYTKGNMLLGVFVFAISAIAIIFGSLSISQLATRTDKPGGLITYAEEFVNTRTACAFGWFQTFLYLPALAAVVAWVTGMYVCQLFGWESSNTVWTLIGAITLVVLFILNMLSAKLGGWFQNSSMVIKLIPLIIIALIGLIFGKPGPVITNDIANMKEATMSATWLTAFAPIAFSFDGWIISTSICHEIKNSKKNLPIALTVAPLIILVTYIAYFVGITSLVGTRTILEHGNDSVFIASNMIFGEVGAKVVLVFIIISVLGTVNGIVLAYIRMPFSLAMRNMLPNSKWMVGEQQDEKKAYTKSAAIAFILTMVWMLIHYLTQKAKMPGDISEIAICVSYLNYLILYLAVIRLAKKGEIKSKFKGYVVPVLAACGSFVILSGSISHPLFIYYIVICILIMGGGYFYYRTHDKNRTKK